MNSPVQLASTPTNNETNERDLVVAFKGGDASAYAQIYREYRPMAESICRRILGNADDAAEAAQETMLKVFQGLPRFNGRYLLRAWVARIATNVCLDMLRKRSRRPEEVDVHPDEEIGNADPTVVLSFAEDPLTVVERSDEGRRVRNLLETMPDHHRDAIWMREFEGKSHEQIARELGMTAPQVKALLHRAKQSFKRSWTGTDGRSFGLVIVLWPARFIRNLVSGSGSAPDAAAVGTGVGAGQAPALVQQVAAASQTIVLTAQPIAAQASSALAERVTAVAAAVAVVGGIGVGASTLPGRGAAPVTAKPPAVQIESESTEAPEARTVATGSAAPTVAPASPTEAPASATPAPSPAHPASQEPATPTPAPESSPPPAPSQSPPPAQPPQPRPQPRPPAYSYGFSVYADSANRCSCPDPRLEASSSDGSIASGSYSFDQSASGPVHGADGTPGWFSRVRYLGNVTDSRGSASMTLSIGNEGAMWYYSASGVLVHTQTLSDGSSRLTFDLDYQTTGGASTDSPLGSTGRVRLTAKVWNDGITLHGVEITQL